MKKLAADCLQTCNTAGQLTSPESFLEAFKDLSRSGRIDERLRSFLASNVSLGGLLRTDLDRGSLQTNTFELCAAEECESFLKTLRDTSKWFTEPSHRGCRVFVRHKASNTLQVHQHLLGDAFSFLLDNHRHLPSWQQVEQIAFAFPGKQQRDELDKTFGKQKFEAPATVQIHWRIRCRDGKLASPHPVTELRMTMFMDSDSLKLEVSLLHLQGLRA